ncbi:MAG TPA: NAD-dependent epimerase/dehydratase family protein [Stellaceae bacterium]|nr:NAD-dependent epimerase/dehydratase family protein [Stellaceae bacterium]
MARHGVLVLGAGGFIGRALVAHLAARGESVIAATRAPQTFGVGIVNRATGTLDAASPWPALLADARAVVYLAGRAHAAPGPGEDWIEDEAATAHALAAAARREGVERIVLLSSIKAHGEVSGALPFRAGDPLAPADPYGRAKARVEAAMTATGAPLVVLRPPLVYGPGVKANFRVLMGLVMRRVPLPLASIANRRSFVHLDNLLDLVALVLTHERAPGRAFLLRDEREVSTPDLVRLIARGFGRGAILLPCPPGALIALAKLFGRSDVVERLIASLRVDDGATRETLGWRPRVALEDGIAATCRWYRDHG